LKHLHHDALETKYDVAMNEKVIGLDNNNDNNNNNNNNYYNNNNSENSIPIGAYLSKNYRYAYSFLSHFLSICHYCSLIFIDSSNSLNKLVL
jgi:hypothetical protein